MWEGGQAGDYIPYESLSKDILRDRKLGVFGRKLKEKPQHVLILILVNIWEKGTMIFERRLECELKRMQNSYS